MTEKEAIEVLLENVPLCCKMVNGRYEGGLKDWDCDMGQAIRVAVLALQDIQQYRDMEAKLRETYGVHGNLLHMVVNQLCRHDGVDIGNPVKSRLLTDKDVDRWERYKAVGTVEECREAMEKLPTAEEAIRKLLCSEYGSSCQFCIHDNDEAAMCCNVGGSGSWCCENAKWNGRLE